MTKLPIGLIRIDFPDGSKDYVTCLEPERLSAGEGIPSEGIIGAILRPLEPGQRIMPDNFAANSVFVKFMQAVIASHGPSVSELIEDAQHLGDGTLYVIDHRTRAPQGRVREVLEQDIFGEFDVENGEILPGSYRPNSKHYLLSSDGFFQLGSELVDYLLDALAAVPDPGDDPRADASRHFVN